jgi:hypothetical protein
MRNTSRKWIRKSFRSEADYVCNATGCCERGGWPTLTLSSIFRVPCSSFAWAGVFSCRRVFRHRQLSLSHPLGTQALSAIQAVALLDLQLLSTPAELHDSAFAWMLRIVTGTRAGLAHAFTTPKSGCPAFLAFFVRNRAFS